MEGDGSLSMATKLAYGMGHIINDMSASMGLTYSILFFHNVIQLSNANAGLIMLLGQIADGIASMLVGILLDQEYTCWIFVRFGKRKVTLTQKGTMKEHLDTTSLYIMFKLFNVHINANLIKYFPKVWHFLGVLCLLLSFPFVFLPPIGLSVQKCQPVATTTTPSSATPNSSTVITGFSPAEECKEQSEIAVTAYYSAFFVIFQLGWATVQISHLSMIPDIASNENSRMALTTTRYAASVISTILVYTVTWLLLDTSKCNNILSREEVNLLMFNTN